MDQQTVRIDIDFVVTQIVAGISPVVIGGLQPTCSPVRNLVSSEFDYTHLITHTHTLTVAHT